MAEEKKIYNRIKAVLAEKRQTNIWLAEKLNKNKTTVSKWCTNDIQPPLETLFEIARVLGVDVKDLLVSEK
jgi:putative transcriptional regulator